MSPKNPCGDQEHKISSADLLPCPSNDNEQKRKGGTMYKANLQRCRSVTLCISRPVSLHPSTIFLCDSIYTIHSLWTLWLPCFLRFLPLPQAHQTHYTFIIASRLKINATPCPSAIQNRTSLRTYLVLRQSVIFRLTAPITHNLPHLLIERLAILCKKNKYFFFVFLWSILK